MSLEYTRGDIEERRVSDSGQLDRRGYFSLLNKREQEYTNSESMGKHECCF